MIHSPTEVLWLKLSYISMCRFLSWHKLSTHLGKYQGMWFLDLMIGICLFLRKKTAKQSFKGVVPFCIPTSMTVFSLLLHILASIWCCSVLDFGYSNIYVLETISFFKKKIFQFPNDVWCIFSYRWENMRCINLHHLCRGHADLCMILILAYVLPRWALPFLLIPKLKDVTAKTNM